MQIKKAGILYHPLVPATRAKAQEISDYLISHGVEVWTSSAWEKEKAAAQLNGTDLIITTGGDGTILRAAQVAFESGVPITGINMGTLGFLTELKAEDVPAALSVLLEGQGWLDERAMLEAELSPGESNGSPGRVFYALNDVVLARGAIARLIQVNTSIDDRPFTTYRADGVILSTATGSTGYSLAAGGPILYPHSQDVLLVPIVPHLGLKYSLVLPAGSRVKLDLVTTHQATLSVDGHINIPVNGGASLKVKTSSRKTRFLRIHPQSDFHTFLEEKLRRKK